MFAAATTTTLITLDPFLLSALIGIVIPLVVALVTKLSLDSRIKAILSIILSAIGGTLVQVNNNGGTFDWKQALVATAVTAGTAIVSYVGAWKPVLDPNAVLAPNRGIG